MKQSEFNIHDHFTHEELQALKLFYEGMPARQIRSLHGDPWPVVAKHRALPKDQYECVQQELANITSRRRKLIIREATPDDPIYTRGFIIGGRHGRRNAG